MTEDQIKHVTQRFLGWRLPETFSPDNGISFKPTHSEEFMASIGKPPMRHEPDGTNLFDAVQAEAMVRHMIEGIPAPHPAALSAPASVAGVSHWCAPWPQMVFELRHPEHQRVGWESNDDLMRAAADELERIAALASTAPPPQGACPDCAGRGYLMHEGGDSTKSVTEYEDCARCASPPPQGDLAVAIKALEPFAHIASHVGLPRDATVHLTSLSGQWIATIDCEDFWRARTVLGTLRTLTGEKGA